MSAVIIASTAAVIASNGARRANCQRVIDGYESATASIEQAQAYANCVLFLHPGVISDETTLILRAFVALAFISFFIGVWKVEWVSLDDSLFSRFMSGLVFVLFISLGVTLVISAWYGAKFVLGVA